MAERVGQVAWGLLVVVVVSALLVIPFAPAIGEKVRVNVCRSTGGSCGYAAARTRCALLARDSAVASAITPMSTVRGAPEGTETTKMLDGGATVRLSDPRLDVLGGDGLGTLAAQRLGVRMAGSAGAGAGLTPAEDDLAAVYRFARHDDADAWLDRYQRVDVPVRVAAVGPGGPGLHTGVRRAVRSLGFGDPDAAAEPDGVVVDVPSQAAEAAGFARASGPLLPQRPQPRPQLTLEVTGRTATTGELPVARTQNEVDGSLATRLGMLAGASWTVTTDAAGRPATLTVTGEAAQRGDGAFVAASSLPRLREQGASLGEGREQADLARQQGIRTVQSVVLDLRGQTNRQAFERVFLAAGPLALLRSAALRTLPRTGTVVADPGPPAAAVRTLLDRLAQDGVYVRTRTRTAPAASVSAGSATTQRTESRLLQGFSEDFAVSASRLSALPGCSQ